MTRQYYDLSPARLMQCSHCHQMVRVGEYLEHRQSCYKLQEPVIVEEAIVSPCNPAR